MPPVDIVHAGDFDFEIENRIKSLEEFERRRASELIVQIQRNF